MKYDKPMMETAYVWANQSYCRRNRVGAVLSHDGRIISTGYNGTITGADNCCEETEAFKSKKEISEYKQELIKECDNCKGRGTVSNFQTSELNAVFLGYETCDVCNGFGKIKDKDTSKNTVVHAEANAILFAARNGIPTQDCTLYITLSPCIECAKMIIQSGIKEVIYDTDYRINHGVEYLKEHGIPVRKFNEA